MDKSYPGLERNPGTSQAAIDAAERELGVRLPSDYVEYMKDSNGCQGMVGDGGYLQLYPIEELKAANDESQVTEWVPGFVLFGSDGGGEAYGFDMRSGVAVVVQVPFIVMQWEDAQILGQSFTEFFSYVANIRD